jgi:hypothetical protein
MAQPRGVKNNVHNNIFSSPVPLRDRDSRLLIPPLLLCCLFFWASTVQARIVASSSPVVAVDIIAYSRWSLRSSGEHRPRRQRGLLATIVVVVDIAIAMSSIRYPTEEEEEAGEGAHHHRHRFHCCCRRRRHRIALLVVVFFSLRGLPGLFKDALLLFAASAIALAEIYAFVPRLRPATRADTTTGDVPCSSCAVAFLCKWRRGAISSSGTTALRPACLLGSTGGWTWRGMVCIIDVEVVEPRVQ